MIHQRHFTLEEANELLPTVEPLLLELREARDLLVDRDAHGALAEAAPANGGGTPGRQVGQAFLRVRALLLELGGLGLVLRDVDRGLIDFPAIREGREVYLCWELGEGPIAHWHELDSGYAGRRRLD